MPPLCSLFHQPDSSLPCILHGNAKTFSSSSSPSSSLALLKMASTELEEIRLDISPSSGSASQLGQSSPCSSSSSTDGIELDDCMHPFPPACRELVRKLPGNDLCVDCGASDPQWASVTYGILLCLRCCGRHRSLGVRVSFVRSMTMDTWTHSQILAMLEGGNEQLSKFFERHSLCEGAAGALRRGSVSDAIAASAVTTVRYRTNAALFYRTELAQHVRDVRDAGVYKGREASRNKRSRQNGSTIEGKQEDRALPSRCQNEKTNPRGSVLRKAASTC